MSTTNLDNQAQTRELHPLTRRLLQPMRVEPSSPSAEYSLVLCLLDRAVRDLSAADATTSRSARQWFESCSQESFAFQSVCDLLDLSGDFIRRILRRASLLK
ncbi:hypothetical protein NG895_02135 [Aeoliella sp. ICT_H6.2]|uniref:Uncharacterized protein n=1 Tax=Aeoliella straminimaris TaxID=2954799 RepID=A0A9X2F5N9_9BACT|nr:hypothetical protein [Aeoliella straminimaris]MCO6042695.1 hypothetical protein [Aeoliella straminimaris]